jgi:hypothetical protein
VKEGPTASSESRAPLLAASLAGFGAGLLPLWDGLSRYRMLGALAGSGLGGGGGAVLPPGVLGGSFLALVVGFAVYQVGKRSIRGAAIVLGLVAFVMVAYAASTGTDVACTRSHAIDDWSLCEKPGTSAQGFGVYLWSSHHKPDFAGPHLDNGDPCVQESEHRDAHAHDYPRGDVTDGLAQIWKRFPDDFSRVVSGTLFVVAAFAGAGFLLYAEARRRRATVAP